MKRLAPDAHLLPQDSSVKGVRRIDNKRQKNVACLELSIKKAKKTFIEQNTQSPHTHQALPLAHCKKRSLQKQNLGIAEVRHSFHARIHTPFKTKTSHKRPKRQLCP